MLGAFAREWGFISTPSLELPSVQEVRTFTEEIGRSGKWNGEALEGFVVRTTVRSSRSPSGPTDRRDASDVPPPYADGSSFFFKVKFDEPYMMYRDWREITKALLARGEGAKLQKSKMARPETVVYVKWVKEEIKKHPELVDGYTKGHGIIATVSGSFGGWKLRRRGAIRRQRVLRRSLWHLTRNSGRRSSCLLRSPVLVRCTFCSPDDFAEHRTKEKQPSLWLLRSSSNLVTHKATMFEPKSGDLLSFKTSKSSCRVMTSS